MAEAYWVSVKDKNAKITGKYLNKLRELGESEEKEGYIKYEYHLELDAKQRITVWIPKNKKAEADDITYKGIPLVDVTG